MTDKADLAICMDKLDVVCRQKADFEKEVHDQAVIIGKSIDAQDKLVMEKRGLEVERDKARRLFILVGKWADHAIGDLDEGRLLWLYDNLIDRHLYEGGGGPGDYGWRDEPKAFTAARAEWLHSQGIGYSHALSLLSRIKKKIDELEPEHMPVIAMDIANLFEGAKLGNDPHKGESFADFQARLDAKEAADEEG